jgi:glucan phosphoethanolaminetransferase (alkaline phosphatase superfamily)
MMPNYQLGAFVVGILGIIISFILLIVGVIKHKKRLKMISMFLFITFIGTTVGYYYETLKDVTNKVNETNVAEVKVEKKVTSGNSDDPLIIIVNLKLRIIQRLKYQNFLFI